jgi:hypothetical protein
MYRERIDVRLARNKRLLKAGYSDAERLSCNVFPLVTSIAWKSRSNLSFRLRKAASADASISPKSAPQLARSAQPLIVPRTVAIVLVPCETDVDLIATD